jgi:hypothetical protein
MYPSICSGAFCDCLVESTPVGTSFEEYIVAVVSSEEELHFAHLKPQQKEFVTSNREARNECVDASRK